MEMVDFDPLEDDDIKTIKTLIENHQKFTESQVAEKLLAEFESAIILFKKVMPKDYKAVLLKNKIKEQVTA
jgi:glutamate synthase (NADPH/NADH) large chain